VHFDEDPAFYKRLSDKLEKLIQDHKDNWKALAEGYEQIRSEAVAGRRENIEGLNKEETTFYDYVADLAFGPDGVPRQHEAAVKKLMTSVVERLQDTIDILDFWKKIHRNQKVTWQSRDRIAVDQHT
jgi:type I restriction enzyme R subunit